MSFGFGLGKFSTTSTRFWPIVLVGQLLAAMILAELGSRILLAGYSYPWGSRLISEGQGWVVGLVAFAYLLPSAANDHSCAGRAVLGRLYVATDSAGRFRRAALALAAIFGVKLFARFNNPAVVAEIVAALLIALAVLVAVFAERCHHPLSLTNTGGVHGPAVWGGVAGSLALGLFSLTCFEGAADISEEAVGTTGSAPGLSSDPWLGRVLVAPSLRCALRWPRPTSARFQPRALQ